LILNKIFSKRNKIQRVDQFNFIRAVIILDMLKLYY
jgi:hypothetical protein